MVDFTLITGFEWDEGNIRKSVDKHGVSQSEAEQIFVNPALLVVADVRHSEAKPRFHALGQTHDGRRLHATFMLREGGTKIRVISIRPMNRKERPLYEQKA